jgi:nicotinamide-nucleotide amidase
MNDRIRELSEQILQEAKTRGLTLATAESCTAGAVAEALSQAHGAADCLHGGIVAYTKAMKHHLLGVSLTLLQEKSAVCTEVAMEMARGVLARSPADVAVSITGVAGPEPDEDGNPVGLIYCAVARKDGPVRAVRLESRAKAREQILQEGIATALRLLHDACCEARAAA